MTQDAQKFTEEDLKKADEIHEKAMTARQCRELTAQALRDERKGLEDERDSLLRQAEIYRLETHRWKEAYEPLNEKAKGLEDRVLELEKRSREGALLGQASLDESNNRVKSLEAENEKLKSEVSHMLNTWMPGTSCADHPKDLLADNARLKAEVSELRPIKDQWVFLVDAYDKVKQHNLKTIKTLEARLAEAVRVLNKFVTAMRKYQMDVEEDAPYEHRQMMSEAQTFLSSPTNSEAQERQRAKDKVVDVARLFHKTNELKDHTALGKALDSLPSEARGGCLHDNGFTYQKGLSVFDKDDKGCPFCDKKTGGV